MAYIGYRQLRIIPGGANAPPSATCERRFDYAMLARRRAPRHPVLRIGTPPPSDSDNGTGFARRSGSLPDADSHAGDAANAPATPLDELPEGNPVMEPAASSIAEHPLYEHVQHAIAPIVSVICERQQRYLRVVGMLAREIGAFCGDRAIASAGNWEVQLTLDPELLPHTTLFLALSRFDIRLRFDVSDRETRDLLLAHSAQLERELDKVMRSWGNARDIHLSVW
ncbi:type III secretion system protein SctP [Burkholderia oklahomensis]|uniref:Type III secretion protein HpaP n=1 Tax=Burkholderia oklahomensis TaxID=342113 RepID=A0AAI8BDF3_9BURK|nr:type III secretion system protein SctP [Burkholderia oklahomensis]AIO69969.1 type III secretion protein HpaP [Burkholderia oklahomensis]AJX36072.1 type III secretion protein HpaP [Burkholderia oklahomensis C6786]MBI0362475.1 type III secretion system protein SctP [Burkholderia oklahomensis]QPS40047.1 type III secretion system protein SctP [Burkholderia oklahomensis]SUY26582.1 type III secretion protein HpaP [Burkholderia oklahomensis]